MQRQLILFVFAGFLMPALSSVGAAQRAVFAAMHGLTIPGIEKAALSESGTS
jgi:hypothetical protein